MDLFETNLNEDKLHRFFKEIKNQQRHSKVREIIQSWGQGLLQRSGESQKFVNEFQTTFNSAFWELYLNKAFIELGMSVDYSKSSPDFCVSTREGYVFNVEAVISDQPKEGLRILDNKEFKVHSTIKLAGKIKDKRDLYLGLNGKKHPYSSLGHVAGRPFVIAVAPFDSATSLMQNNELINRILFGIDTPDRDALVTGRQKKISSITKKSGSEVPLGIFTNDSYKEISAVIFSTTGTFGKAQVESKVERIIRSTRYRKNIGDLENSIDARNTLNIETAHSGLYNYMAKVRFNIEGGISGSDINICHSSHHHETHLDGMHIYYNPYAEIPLDKSVFSASEVTHNFYDLIEKIPVQDHPDGALVSRELYDFNESNYKWLIFNNSAEALSKSYGVNLGFGT